VLREDQYPNDLPERKSELNELEMSLQPATRGVGVNNVFLQGKSGQGKTATAKEKLSEIVLLSTVVSSRCQLASQRILPIDHGPSFSDHSRWRDIRPRSVVGSSWGNTPGSPAPLCVGHTTGKVLYEN